VSALDELIAIAPPPPDPAHPIDWAASREKLGVDLPPDYVELAERYGSGSFEAGIGPWVPGHPNRALDLLRRVDGVRDVLRVIIAGGEEMPYAPDDLVPWAVDEAGNFIWWHMTDRARPEDWPVVAFESRGDEWLYFDGGAVAFLVAILSRRIDGGFLVTDGDPTVFIRYPWSAEAGG
jgi:hypothetical protein